MIAGCNLPAEIALSRWYLKRDIEMDTSEEKTISFRAAARKDLPTIIQMLADDDLGSKREDPSSPLKPSYDAAFEAIDIDPNNELVVAALENKLVGVLQITFIPCLTHRGGWRALIEGVRVSKAHRSSGVGRLMLNWAIQCARKRGCTLVQLTTDKSRPDALCFYESMGFVASHEGMKLSLETGDSA